MLQIYAENYLYCHLCDVQYSLLYNQYKNIDAPKGYYPVMVDLGFQLSSRFSKIFNFFFEKYTFDFTLREVKPVQSFDNFKPSKHIHFCQFCRSKRIRVNCKNTPNEYRYRSSSLIEKEYERDFSILLPEVAQMTTLLIKIGYIFVSRCAPHRCTPVW